MMVNLNVQGGWLLLLLTVLALLSGLLLGSRELFNPAEARRRDMEIEIQRRIQELELEKLQRQKELELEMERERLRQQILLEARRENIRLHIESFGRMALHLAGFMLAFALSFYIFAHTLQSIQKPQLSRKDIEPWDNPYYRRYRRDLARALERLGRNSNSGHGSSEKTKAA